MVAFEIKQSQRPKRAKFPYPILGMINMKIKFATILITALLCTSCAGLSEKEPVFTDKELNIMWTIKTSKVMMSWPEALEYVYNLNYHGYSDWRLPTKKEIDSILDKKLVSEDPFAANVPLHEPFRKPSKGFMFSGTMVEGHKNAPYILNIRNGHIFNGQGRSAYVRAVRDIK